MLSLTTSEHTWSATKIFLRWRMMLVDISIFCAWDIPRHRVWFVNLWMSWVIFRLASLDCQLGRCCYFFSSHSRGQKCEKKLAKLVPRMHRDGVHATRKLSRVDGSGYGSFIRGTQFWCGKANNPQYLQISPEMRDIKPPSSWEVCDIGLTFQVDKKTALEKTCFLFVYR